MSVAGSVDVGAASDFEVGQCVAVADGTVVIVRTDVGFGAFENRCGHQDSPISGGWLRDGRLICPQHFWAFDPVDGCDVRGGDGLRVVPLEIVDDRVLVTMPETGMPVSIREQLLAHARTWNREASP